LIRPYYLMSPQETGERGRGVGVEQDLHAAAVGCSRELLAKASTRWICSWLTDGNHSKTRLWLSPDRDARTARKPGDACLGSTIARQAFLVCGRQHCKGSSPYCYFTVDRQRGGTPNSSARQASRHCARKETRSLATRWNRPSTARAPRAATKGFDAAMAALEMANLMRQLRQAE
jgi:hypothetical protein